MERGNKCTDSQHNSSGNAIEHVHAHVGGELAIHKRYLTHHPRWHPYMFVWAMVGWITLPFFSFCFLKASVLYTCISMYIRVACMVLCVHVDVHVMILSIHSINSLWSSSW